MDLHADFGGDVAGVRGAVHGGEIGDVVEVALAGDEEVEVGGQAALVLHVGLDGVRGQGGHRVGGGDADDLEVADVEVEAAPGRVDQPHELQDLGQLGHAIAHVGLQGQDHLAIGAVLDEGAEALEDEVAVVLPVAGARAQDGDQGGWPVRTGPVDAQVRSAGEAAPGLGVGGLVAGQQGLVAGHRGEVQAVLVQEAADALALGSVEGVELGGEAADDGDLDAVEAEAGQVLKGRVDGQLRHAPGAVSQFHDTPRAASISA